MIRLRIGQKIIFVLAALLVLFGIGLALMIGSAEYRNLTSLKTEELERMSQILATQITDMQRTAAVTVNSLEENEPAVNEMELLTNLGPYYADPGSYFAEDFMAAGVQVEDADQIYVLQAQLQLLQLLQASRRVNELSAVSLYLISPYEVVEDAQPVLSLRLDDEGVYVNRFLEKGDVEAHALYRVATDDFEPPPPDYFDISTAYSAPPAQFYSELGFEPWEEQDVELFFAQDWRTTYTPRSEMVFEGGMPVLYTWGLVQLPVAHPETWETEMQPAAVAVIEQRLSAAVIADLSDHLSLPVGFSRGGRLFASSLAGGALEEPLTLPPEGIVGFEGRDYYYSLEPIFFSNGLLAGTNAVTLSPVDEVASLIIGVLSELALFMGVAVLLTGVAVYFSMRFLVTRPLTRLTTAVDRVSAGDLSMEVPVRAQDELGQLARAFKAMAGRLRELISSLEERVAARTRDLEERAVQLRASAEVGRAIATIRDLDALLPEVTRLISERFGFYHVGIFLLDEAGQKAVLRAANSRGGKEMLEAGHSLQVGEQGIVGYVTQMGKPRIALDVGEDAVHFRNPYLPETHSEVALPLMLGDRILGALDVQSRETGAFDEDDVAVLQVLADQVVVAIENARLFTEMEKAVEAERRAYGEISRAAWSEILRARAIEGYYSDEGGVYALGPHRSIPRVDDDGMELLEIPVKERDVLVGTIEVRKPAGAGGWTESERELLETLAARVGAALENARLYEDSVRRTLRERMVSEISDRLRSSTDVEGVLRATVAELGRTLGALGTIRMVPAEDGGDGRDRE